MRHYYYCYYDEDKRDFIKTEITMDEAKSKLENCYTDVDILLDVFPCPSIYPLMSGNRIVIDED